ncbi:MAG TPA: hypothetical protein VK789_04590 [Bryobacteraceae bacterium]|nr:hypothetical protein [Bryobacteraceae bacterium]
MDVLDGFSINPRTMVCFSGAIDPGTLKNGISYLPLDGSSAAIYINQIFYDPASNCAFAKPDQILRQQTRYLLAITDNILDSQEQKVHASSSFSACLIRILDPYCRDIDLAALRFGFQLNGRLVSASLFTTMSATTWLEQARQFADTNEPPVVLPAGPVSVFQLSNLTSMTWMPQDAPAGAAQPVPLSVLSNVDSIAFGLFLSPNFLNLSGPSAGSISPTATNLPIQAPIPVPGLPPNIPAGFVPVSFHVFLPSAAKSPAKGFPVVIYGHGMGDNQFGAPTYIASTLASHGFATLAFEITGHGYGAGGTVQLTDKAGNTYLVSTPGRGVAFSPAPIGPTDGCILPGAIAVRDCARQTAVDLYAMISVLRKTKGFGYLDPNRVYYVGQSFGSTYGTLFDAVEPAVGMAVLNGAGGTSVDVARLAISGRPLAAEYLQSANPALLNVPPAPPEPYFHDGFNDNYVLRDQAPVINSVPGAPAIQAAFEIADWVGMLGDPLAYAQHLSIAPLAGVPPKSTLFQFGVGDLEVPNPTESAVVRAAGAVDSTWLLRFDIAAGMQPSLLGVMQPGVPFPILPHRILSNPTIFGVAPELSISLAEQQQIASFFQGSTNLDPDQYLTPPFSPAGLFQGSPALPETLNFLQIPQ